jgi:hypothetical protein
MRGKKSRQSQGVRRKVSHQPRFVQEEVCAAHIHLHSRSFVPLFDSLPLPPTRPHTSWTCFPHSTIMVCEKSNSLHKESRASNTATHTTHRRSPKSHRTKAHNTTSHHHRCRHHHEVRLTPTLNAHPHPSRCQRCCPSRLLATARLRTVLLSQAPQTLALQRHPLHLATVALQRHPLHLATLAQLMHPIHLATTVALQKHPLHLATVALQRYLLSFLQLPRRKQRTDHHDQPYCRVHTCCSASTCTESTLLLAHCGTALHCTCCTDTFTLRLPL